MTLDELLAMDEIEDLSEWRNGVSQGVADLSAGMPKPSASIRKSPHVIMS